MIECRTTCIAAVAAASVCCPAFACCAGTAQAIEGASPRLDGGSISIRTAAIPLPSLHSNEANFAPGLVTRYRLRTVESVAYDTRDAAHGSMTVGDSSLRRVGTRVSAAAMAGTRRVAGTAQGIMLLLPSTLVVMGIIVLVPVLPTL